MGTVEYLSLVSASGNTPITKTELAYRTLRAWIITGQLRPGEALGQDRLAEILPVSRTPVRYAINRLKGEGLIVGDPHRGATVAPLSLSEIEDLHSARCAIEDMLITRAVHYLEKIDIPRIEHLLEQQTNAVRDADLVAYVQYDREFHDEIYRASGQIKSISILGDIRDRTDRYTLAYSANDSMLERSILEHSKYIEYCAKGRSVELIQLTREHLHKTNWKQALSQAEDTSAILPSRN